VNEYTSVPAAKMFALAIEATPALRQFDPRVRAFLKKELF